VEPGARGARGGVHRLVAGLVLYVTIRVRHRFTAPLLLVQACSTRGTSSTCSVADRRAGAALTRAIRWRRR
jgi:hypothetical protein